MTNMTINKTRIAVFCSGSGSNFKALFEAISKRLLQAEIALCLSNRARCGAMEFAEQNGIATAHITEKQFASFDEFAVDILCSFIWRASVLTSRA